MRSGIGATSVQEEGRTPPTEYGTLRLSRSHQDPASPSASPRDTIPLRRIILWIVVALAVVLGLVLYFIYEPRVATLLA